MDKRLVEITDKLQRGEVTQALADITTLKSRRENHEGLDLLRARCFLAQNRSGDAREALLEELRHFPDNRRAQAMWREIVAGEQGQWRHQDKAFEALLHQIRPFTMLPVTRLYNLYQRALEVCGEDIPGDFAECGVAGGGATAMLAHVIATHSKRPRLIHGFDSFCGMPTPGEHDLLPDGTAAEHTGWGTGTCAAPEEAARTIAAQLGCADRVRLYKGFFEETLPKVKLTPLALLHADGDWYDSMRTILTWLYPLVTSGGRVIFDDYGYWQGSTRAVDEYLAGHEQGAVSLIAVDDGCAAWMRKP